VAAQEINGSPATEMTVGSQEAIETGVSQLLTLQDEDGAWPYEGVYRVRGKIPVGYRVGGTAICCEALMYATRFDHQAANGAINRGVDRVLEELASPLMKTSTADRYDVRIWGHIYALDLFCRMRDSDRFRSLHEKLAAPIAWLTQAVITEQMETGGWNYAGRQRHAPFVTAPAMQALLWAKQMGQAVEVDVLKRAQQALVKSCSEDGGFAYSGEPSDSFMNRLPGSIARTPAAEITLQLGGMHRNDQLESAIDSFYKHWEELEKRRKQSGTHARPYGVAPYYFYFGHRYLAQAIAGLPEAKRSAEYDRFHKLLIKTRDDDGTWNDRVFPQSATYGTAMAVLALLGDRVPLPTAVDVTIR
jgi:hypothetical protein